MKYVVVGTSHAGFEAVETFLKLDSEAEIHLYEKGDKASFLSCGIQSFLEGKTDSLDNLHYATGDSYTEQGVNVHLESEIIGFDEEKQTVTVKSGNDESEQAYDKLFLSPGAVPIEIPIPGADLENLYYLRGRDWADKVNERMKDAKKAVVVGGGYIGIEAAEAFAKAGIDVTVIDALDTILPTYLDSEFTEILEKQAADNGMNFRGGEAVKEIQGESGKVAKVVTDKGEYEADTVLMAVGVRPNTGWLDGLVDLTEKGFIKTNKYQQTSAKNVYAAGDATFVPFAPGGDDRPIALASNAHRQAFIAAKNIVEGDKYEMPAVSGTSALSLFDYHFATTGVKSVDADSIGEEVESATHKHHYRPKFLENPYDIYMKVYYTKADKRIVGLQLMSEANVMQAINVGSMAISAKWTLEDLALQDFFFQPEYNNTWNFLNTLAQVALGEDYGSTEELF